MNTLLVFGSSGFVGAHVASYARQAGWQVAGVAGHAAAPAGPWEQLSADIGDARAVEALIARVRPTAVVNAAAIADIDRAEREQPLAWRVNVEGAANVARTCAERGIRHLFLSSDAVFGGTQVCYREDDEPAPVNYYGRTKAEAEAQVLTLHPRSAVVRLSLVLGFALEGSGNAYLSGLERRLLAREPIPCATDEIRSPIDVLTVAACLVELAEKTIAGVLHIAATEAVDRYTLACDLARRLGLDAGLLRPVLATVQPGRAPRHRLGHLCVERAQALLCTTMPSLAGVYERALGTRNPARRGDTT